MSCKHNCIYCHLPCNSCNCVTRCVTCRQCSCNECSSSVDNCGCKYPSFSDCVTLQKIDTNCITGMVSGISLTTAINLQNDYICNSIINPSGNLYNVSSCDDDNILVTKTIINPSGHNITNFEVCLNPTLVEQIEDNTTNIATISACLDNAVTNITTGTPLYLTITDVGDNVDCGKTWNINYNPSGNSNYDGIVINDPTSNSSSGTGVQILATFNRNYIAYNNISNGDEIRFAFEGDITSAVAPPGSIIFEIFDANSATIIYSFTESSFVKGDNIGWEIVGSIRKMTASTTFVTAHVNHYPFATGTYNSLYYPERGVIKKSVTSSLDYSNLSLRIKVNVAVASATISNKLTMVEVRKKI